MLRRHFHYLLQFILYRVVCSMPKNGALSFRCKCECTGYFSWPHQNIYIHRNAGSDNICNVICEAGIGYTLMCLTLMSGGRSLITRSCQRPRRSTRQRSRRRSWLNRRHRCSARAHTHTHTHTHVHTHTLAHTPGMW